MRRLEQTVSWKRRRAVVGYDGRTWGSEAGAAVVVEVVEVRTKRWRRKLVQMGTVTIDDNRRDRTKHLEERRTKCAAPSPDLRKSATSKSRPSLASPRY